MYVRDGPAGFNARLVYGRSASPVDTRHQQLVSSSCAKFGTVTSHLTRQMHLLGLVYSDLSTPFVIFSGSKNHVQLLIFRGEHFKRRHAFLMVCKYPFLLDSLVWIHN